MAGLTIKEIAQGIKNALNTYATPVVTIPPLLLLCEINNRPGLSAISLASALIERMQEYGIPTGPNPDGSENLLCKMAYGGSGDLIDEFHNHAVVDLPLQPGSISITGTGGNAGGPVAITGANNVPVTLKAVIR